MYPFWQMRRCEGGWRNDEVMWKEVELRSEVFERLMTFSTICHQA